MSTRANVIIRDSDCDEELIFYRHCDGYPEGVMPSLQKFMGWVRSGKIRSNVEQASGWLVLLGAVEYATIPFYEVDKYGYGGIETIEDPKHYGCGAFEPSVGIHGDIEFLYVVDLSENSITCYDSYVNLDDDICGGREEESPLFVDTEDDPWHPDDMEKDEEE